MVFVVEERDWGQLQIQGQEGFLGKEPAGRGSVGEKPLKGA